MATLSLNVGNFITLRLTPNNYPLWREQALALAESQELVGHLTNEDPAPNKYSNRLLRRWIIGTLSEEALSPVVGLDTAYAVWEALKNAYAQESQEREFTLRQQLTYLRKEDHTTITEHIRTFKGLCDNLAAIRKPIPDQEKVFCPLTSLGPQYETFTTTMLKPPRPSYSELVSQLQNYDQGRNWFSNHIDIQASTLTHPVAFYGKKQQRSQSNNSGYRGPAQTFTSTGCGFQAQQSNDSRQAYNSSPSSAQRRPPPPGERRMTPSKREKYRDQQCQ
ncbi:hypothetical protein Pint_25957 [Pistacia integerrima]|uniref:Uncharacterized protein n=1 Tax=Pistacia integerrima TaxID=434235 RepID=A0ACC0YCC0_9ROSI|nr:hypothetical protein Pint_25957 [Pistacia integerrima]